MLCSDCPHALLHATIRQYVNVNVVLCSGLSAFKSSAAATSFAKSFRPTEYCCQRLNHVSGRKLSVLSRPEWSCRDMSLKREFLRFRHAREQTAGQVATGRRQQRERQWYLSWSGGGKQGFRHQRQDQCVVHCISRPTSRQKAHEWQTQDWFLCFFQQKGMHMLDMARSHLILFPQSSF